jgi:RNA polymerase sigma-B factor
MPLARSLAQRYRGTPEPLEDLTQVAYVGLLNAIDRFDPQRGTAFSSFAVPTILGELRRHFRDRCGAVHVPRTGHERAVSLKHRGEGLAKELGRSPTLAEIAESLGWTLEQALEARGAAAAYEATSLDAPVRSRPGDDAPAVVETIGSEDDGYAGAEARATIAALWRTLGERDQRVLRMRFAEDLLQRDIADRLGCSQMHVSRLIRAALSRMAVRASTGTGGRTTR